MRNRLSRPLPALRAVVLTLLLTACTTENPATGERNFTPLMSPKQERQVGASEHPKILQEFGGIYDDPKVGAWIAGLGGRLVASSELPGESFTFSVLDTEMVNAFALPGGYVYVTRGLLALANTEAEVAGVLAHEIGHVTARHTAQRVNTAVFANLAAAALGVLTGSGELAQVGQVVGAGALAQYSQSQEYEADSLGIRYMTRIGYNPLAQADFLASLQREHELQQAIAGRQGEDPLAGFFATHPNTADRVQRAAAEAREHRQGVPELSYGRAALLQNIDGMIYGDSPEQGYARGRTFSHPKLGFTFTVPEGFKLTNRPAAVSAQHASGAALLFDRAPKPRSHDPLDYLREEWAKNVPLEDLGRLTVNGLPAATASAQGRTNQGRRELRLLAIRFAPGEIYRFIFISPPNQSPQASEPFRQTAFSFRRLSQSEAQRLQPYRLRVVTVGPGDTVQSLARRMVLGDHQEARFRILNALPEGTGLRPGDRVKLVTDG